MGGAPSKILENLWLGAADVMKDETKHRWFAEVR